MRFYKDKKFKVRVFFKDKNKDMFDMIKHSRALSMVFVSPPRGISRMVEITLNEKFLPRHCQADLVRKILQKLKDYTDEEQQLILQFLVGYTKTRYFENSLPTILIVILALTLLLALIAIITLTAIATAPIVVASFTSIVASFTFDPLMVVFGVCAMFLMEATPFIFLLSKLSGLLESPSVFILGSCLDNVVDFIRGEKHINKKNETHTFYENKLYELINEKSLKNVLCRWRCHESEKSVLKPEKTSQAAVLSKEDDKARLVAGIGMFKAHVQQATPPVTNSVGNIMLSQGP